MCSLYNFCFVYRVLKRLWQFSSIFVYIGRSFPTHRTLMGDRPEAIEGQAKLFRVLTAFARYNPQIGYVQGNELPVLPQMRSLASLKSYWTLCLCFYWSFQTYLSIVYTDIQSQEGSLVPPC